MADLPRCTRKMDKDEEAQARALAGQMRSQQDQQKAAQAQKEKEEEMAEKKRVMVRAMLEPDALERLNRIGLVRPEKQQQLEGMILNAMQRGMIQQKIDEGQLIKMIEQVDEKIGKSTTTVKIQRKRADSDDSIDLDNL